MHVLDITSSIINILYFYGMFVASKQKQEMELICFYCNKLLISIKLLKGAGEIEMKKNNLYGWPQLWQASDNYADDDDGDD